MSFWTRLLSAAANRRLEPVKLEYLTDLKPGDKVHHKMMPDLIGEFVRYEGPYGPFVNHPNSNFALPVHGMLRRVWWKGFDPKFPELADWTWEWAIEPHVD